MIVNLKPTVLTTFIINEFLFIISVFPSQQNITSFCSHCQNCPFSSNLQRPWENMSWLGSSLKSCHNKNNIPKKLFWHETKLCDNFLQTLTTVFHSLALTALVFNFFVHLINILLVTNLTEDSRNVIKLKNC